MSWSVQGKFLLECRDLDTKSILTKISAIYTPQKTLPYWQTAFPKFLVAQNCIKKSKKVIMIILTRFYFLFKLLVMELKILLYFFSYHNAKLTVIPCISSLETSNSQPPVWLEAVKAQISGILQLYDLDLLCDVQHYYVIHESFVLRRKYS